MFGKLINILKENPKKIVFTEGSDPRILEAASRLLASTFLSPILVGNKDEIAKAAEESAFNIRGAEIIDPMEYEDIDEMAECLYELRKNKGMTLEKAKATCQQANYFGTMLVKMGKADALLGGATYSTVDTVRPALQIINKGFPESFWNDRLPRNCIFTPEPACPDSRVISNPATLPCKACIGFELGFITTSSLFTEVIAPVKSRFFIVP